MQPWPSVSCGKPFLRARRAGEPRPSRPAAGSHAACSRCEDAREAAAPQVGSDLVPAAGPAAARPDCPAPAQGAETSLPGRGQGPAPLALREAPACPLRDLPPLPSLAACLCHAFTCLTFVGVFVAVGNRGVSVWLPIVGLPSWTSRVPHAAARPQVPGPAPGPADVRGVSEGGPRMQSRPDPEMGCSPHASSSRKRGVVGDGLPSSAGLGPAGVCRGSMGCGRELALIVHNTAEGHTLRDGPCCAHAHAHSHMCTCVYVCVHVYTDGSV